MPLSTEYRNTVYGMKRKNHSFNIKDNDFMNEEHGLRFRGKWSISLNKDFICFSGKVISDRSKVIYQCLKSFVNPNGESNFPSIDFISNMLCCNKKTVSKELKKLQQLGLIEIEQLRNEKGHFKKNIYTVVCELDWLKENANLQNR